MRKYNGSIGTIVQGFLDFANKGNAEVGSAILSNSAWKLLLQPKVEELKECVSRNLLALSEAELRIAETIRTTKGSYSEVLLLSSNQSSVFPLMPKLALRTILCGWEKIARRLCELSRRRGLKTYLYLS